MAEEMTAEQAYASASAAIARAGAEGATYLNFGGKFSATDQVWQQLPALTRLPPELADLTRLTRLDLDGTQVGDAGVSALSGLVGLQLLDLQRTQVGETGLAVLSRVRGFLCPGGQWGEIWLVGRPALQNPELAQIYRQHNGGERTKKLFAWLRGKYPAPTDPPPDRPVGGSYHLPDDGPVTSDPVHAGAAAAELEALRAELTHKAAALIGALEGSNQHQRLSGTAARYCDRLDRPVPDIRLDLLFSAANTLRQALQGHQAADRAGEFNRMLPGEAGPMRWPI